ncbi:MAG: YjgP/YjgQ family permease [Candidatus Omnitrophica bacterium]|nr:YjgP/YjgQ family permease [Candidatus Omnitrophota bacterium]
MRLTDRYIIRQLLAPLFYCLIIFIFLYIIIDLFGHLDEILKQKVTFDIVLKYYIYFIPIIFVQTAPIAILVSTIYVLGNLNRYNEITAMKAGGMSIWVIIRPFLALGLLLSMVVFIINERFVPSASITTKTIKEERMEKRFDASSKKLIDNVAIYGANNQMIYARFYEPSKKTLINPIVMINDGEKNLTTKIIADEGKWIDQSWIFYHCAIYNFDKNNQIVGEPQLFNEKVVSIEEKPDDFLRYEVRAEFMNYEQLKKYIKKLYGAGSKITNKLLVDLNYKLSFPIISLIIVLVGIPFAITTKRGGALLGVAVSIAISLVYYGMIAVCIALGKAGFLPPIISSWSSNIIFASLGLYLISKLR